MEILSLGEKIKRKRKELNMTLKELAKDRITPGQISLVESGKSNPSMDLLEYLAGNLNTTVEYLMESEESQAEKISSYYEKVASSYIVSGNYEKGKENIEKSRFYAEKYNIECIKGKILYLTAYIYAKTGQLELAEQNFLSANVLFIKNGKFEDIVKTYLNLGQITLKLKAYKSANSYLMQAEAVYFDNNIGNDMILGDIYYNISKVYSVVDDVDETLKYASLAEKCFRRIRDKENYSNELLNSADKYSKKHDIANAIKYADKALEMKLDIDKNNNMALIEKSLGDIFYNHEKIDESFYHYEIAKEIKISNSDNNINSILISMCKNHIKRKDIRKCEELLESIYSRLEKDDFEGRIQCNLIKYRIFCIKEHKKEAEALLIDTYNYAKKCDIKNDVAELSIRIAQFYIAKKNENLASKYLEEAVFIYRELGIVQ